MAELDVHIVTAAGIVWQGAARSLSATAADGEIGILPGHTPMLASLGIGRLRLNTPTGETWSALLSGGFLSVDDDTVAVVADSVEDIVSGAPQGAGR